MRKALALTWVGGAILLLILIGGIFLATGIMREGEVVHDSDCTPKPERVAARAAEAFFAEYIEPSESGGRFTSIAPMPEERGFVVQVMVAPGEDADGPDCIEDTPVRYVTGGPFYFSWSGQG